MILIILAFTAACREVDKPRPEIDSVNPYEVSAKKETETVVQGRHFYTEIRNDIASKSPPSLDRRFVVHIDEQEMPSEKVAVENTETMSIFVPGGLSIGTHSLTLTTPGGLSTTREQAFEVVEDQDSGDAGADADTDSDTDADTDSDTDADTDSDTDTDTDTDTDADTDSDTDTDTDTDADTDWWDTEFNKRRKLIFDNSAQDGGLEDFPVLVVLDDGWFDYGSTRDAGLDIRFVDDDAVDELPHEIESFDKSGSSYIWVRVPEIDRLANDDFIWMYYGDPSVSGNQNPHNVWQARYEAVYHLNESFDDSTSNEFHGTNNGTSDAPDAIGHGRDFNGVSNYVDLGPDLPILQSVSECTLSAWVRADWFFTDCFIVAMSVHNELTTTTDSRATIGLTSSSEALAGGRSNDTEDWQTFSTTGNSVTTGNWYHVVGIIDYAGDSVKIYVNGALAGEGTVVFSQSTTPDTTATNSTIGSQDDGSASFFNGIIDEVRISDIARTPSWIAAQYLSHTDSFITFGQEENAP